MGARNSKARPGDNRTGTVFALKSWVEISADKLAANFAAVRTAAPGFEVLAVIKADAYGHGAEHCALALVAAGAQWFGVTDLEEGQRVRQVLRESGWTAPTGTSW